MDSAPMKTSSYDVSQLPTDLCREILSYVINPFDLLALCCVSKSWNQLTNDNELWRSIFIREFGVDLCAELLASLNQETQPLWKHEFFKFLWHGFPYDTKAKHEMIELSNSGFDAKLIRAQGGSHHAVRFSQGREKGIHYFEVTVLGNKPSDDATFNNGQRICIGVGIASGDLDAILPVYGWTQANNGMGLFNKGTFYINGIGPAYGLPFKTNDLVGIEYDLDNNFVNFYLNGEVLFSRTSVIPREKFPIYPYIFFSNWNRHAVRITAARPGSMSEVSYAKDYKTFKDMGFQQDCYHITKLMKRYQRNIGKVVDILLNEK